MEEIADYAVGTASKLFRYSEAYAEHNASYSFAIEQGKANGGAFVDKKGIRLRVIKGGNLYTYSTNIFDKQSIALALSGLKGFMGYQTSLSKEKAIKAESNVKERDRLDKTELFKNLAEIDRLLGNDKRVIYRAVYGGISREETYFTNSEGSEIRRMVPSISYFISFIVGNGRETRQRFIQLGSVGGMEQQKVSSVIEKVEEEVKNIYEVIEKGRSISASESSKIRNIVISPEIAGIAVHESIGHPSEADRVFGREAAQAGTSYLNKGNFGTRIASDYVTIIDNPKVKNAYGFFDFDDEGVRARSKTLVSNGIQKELLTNREYAAFLGTRSNGSARSDSYSNEPIVRMSNTYLQPGTAKFDELVAEARNGIYIKSFTEWNIDDTRSFARYQGNEAYEIKNGSIGKQIKNYKLETTTINFWKSVRMVGNEFALYTGTCGKGEPIQGVNVTMGGAPALLSFSD